MSRVMASLVPVGIGGRERPSPGTRTLELPHLASAPVSAKLLKLTMFGGPPRCKARQRGIAESSCRNPLQLVPVRSLLDAPVDSWLAHSGSKRPVLPIGLWLDIHATPRSLPLSRLASIPVEL